MKILVFHVVAVAHHLFTTYFKMMKIDLSDAVGKDLKTLAELRWHYLTMWSFAIQTTFFVVCLLGDLLDFIQSKKLTKIKQKARTLKNFLYSSLVFPLACAVSVQFWVLFYYDRELVYPVALDTKLPLWFNHSLHTFTLVAPLLEILLVDHQYPRRGPAIGLLSAVLCSYAACIAVTFITRGLWPYPMLYKMGWDKRAMFLVTNIIMCTAFYMVGEKLRTVLWGYGARAAPQSKKQKSK